MRRKHRHSAVLKKYQNRTADRIVAPAQGGQVCAAPPVLCMLHQPCTPTKATLAAYSVRGT